MIYNKYFYTVLFQILTTPIQLSRPDKLSEEDIQLDNKCLECIEKYINSNSAMKSRQELALQGFRESYQQLIDLSRGLRKAHGVAWTLYNRLSNTILG